MTGKIDPLFANHPDVAAMEKQTQRFVDEFRAQSKSYLDELLTKENEIARLLTALVRIQSVLRPADNADNIETVGRAIEIAAAAAGGES